MNHLIYEDDDEYEELPDYIKDGYYLLKVDNLPEGMQDTLGQWTENNFIRIPKGRISAVLGDTAVNMYRTLKQQDDVWDNYFSEVVLNNIGINNPWTNNLFSGLKQATENEAWYGGNIYSEGKYKGKLPVEITDEKTDQLSNWIAKTLHDVVVDTAGEEKYKELVQENKMFRVLATPKLLNYAMDQYSGFIGDIVLPKLTPFAENEAFIDQFTTSSTLKSNISTKFYDILDNCDPNSEYATETDKITYKYLTKVSKEIGSLYKEQSEIQNSDLSPREKMAKTYEIKEQINDKMKEAVNEVENLKIDDGTATFNGTTYYKDNEDNWKEVEEDDKISGIQDTTYADYKNKLSVATKKKREAEGNKDVNLTEKEKDKILLNSTYSDKEKDSIYTQTVGKKDDAYKGLKIVANPDIDTYLDYKSQTFESLDDPNSNVVGKKVTKGEGTKKSQTINYIRNSNMSTAEQEYLISTQYKLDSTKALREYIDGLNLSPEDYNTVMSGIASSNVEQLKDGTWRWKK